MLRTIGLLTPLLGGSLIAIASPTLTQAAPIAAQPDQQCKSQDLSSLEQGLVPTSPEPPETLPQNSALDLPQQPQLVVIQQTLVLNLPNAVRLAFDRNPDLQVIKLQLQRSCAQLKQAKAANFPTLTVSSSISRTDGDSFAPQQRIYSVESSQTQEQSSTALRQGQFQAQQALQQKIQELQNRFQQISTQDQNTLEQQLAQLQQRSSSSAILSSPLDLTPLTPSDAELPLSASTSAGGTGSFFNAALRLNYALLTGGRRDASIQAAKKQVENSILAIQLQLQRLRQSITTSYIDLQQSQALIEVAESAVNNAQETLKTTQLGERAGIKTKFDVLQNIVTLADAQQNQTQAKSLYRIARRQLVQQLSLPENVDITLPTPSKAEKGGLWPLSLEETIILALNNRIELNQIKLQRQVVQLQKRVVASQKQPQVFGFASFNLADDLEDQVLGDYGYSVGVQVNFNVFDGGDVQSQLDQLDQTLKGIDQQFSQAKELIRLEVEQSYFTLNANATNIEIANQALAQAQEGFRLAQLRLQAGVGTNLEVTRAQAALTQGQGNLVAAILDYNRALANLEKATGYANLAAP